MGAPAMMVRMSAPKWALITHILNPIHVIEISSLVILSPRPSLHPCEFNVVQIFVNSIIAV
jgi:hypothetical protein